MKEFYKILIVDDEITIRNFLERFLTLNLFKVNTCSNGKEALNELYKNEYDLMLLDINLKSENGLDTAKEIKKNKDFKDFPIIFITGLIESNDKQKGFEAGCVDYICKPFDANELLMRVNLHIELAERRKEAINYAKTLEERIIERTSELYQTRKALIISLANLAESRDHLTGMHIIRTQEYSKIIALELAKFEKYNEIMTDQLINLIYETSPLHDIGKVGIPDKILLKKEKLSDEELKTMKTHVSIGKKTIDGAIKILGDNLFFKIASDIIYSHHERYDGKGYPLGLKNDEIPIAGRIVGLCDAYDALISDRVYKKAWAHKKAKEYIISQKGKHFDPDIVDIFINKEKQFINIYNKYSD